jgi:hypothetical protein
VGAWGVITAAGAALVGGLLAPVLEGWAAWQRGGTATVGFDTALVWACAVVGLAVTCWLWITATVVVADAWRGSRRRRRGVPVFVRRATLAMCGVALTGGVTGILSGPALAAGSDAGPDLAPQLTGLRLPERVAVAPLAPGDEQSTSTAQSTVLVEPGDTLWQIAADHLGDDATDVETARAWPAIYALNRDLIGPDPGHIEPGQRLRMPATDAAGIDR